MAKKIKTPAEMQGTKIKTSTASKIFDTCNTIFLVALCFVTLYPMWYVLCASFTNNVYLVSHPGAVFWPVGFTTGSYAMAFEHPLILSGYKNILIILAVSLPINIIMTLFCGYFLASKGMMFKGPIQFLIMFTMFFGGGMIPTYLNIRSLGLFDSLWALILPGTISAWNMIIMKNYFQSIPPSLEESASLDGATPLITLVRIIIPVSMPVMATVALMYGVVHWNSYFNAVLYIYDQSLMTLPIYLRMLLSSTAMDQATQSGVAFDSAAITPETMKMATIVASVLPILIIYPFIQKYFVKGIMVGSIKG
jgi:putative aldouronate transport system permease protein